MFHSLKDLLPNALNRGRISRQVVASQMVEVASQALQDALPARRQSDARVLSFKEGVLTIECANGSVADFVREREGFLLSALKKIYGDQPMRLQTRLVGSFRGKMPVNNF